MPVEIFMDCGAPSLYNKLSRAVQTAVMGSHIRNRRRDSFAYVDTDEYLEYRKQYAEFLLKEKDYLFVYSNLDVINNADLTYKNQKWFEKRGLKPLPVWHFGSDIKHLRRYIAEGYQYLCIGGMVPNPKNVLKPALDRIWREVLTDKEGMPIVKIHGFAMTSFDLMYRYPWFSVDSKSWGDYARFGFILVPPTARDGSLDWRHPARIAVSDRSLEKRKPDTHYRYMDPAVRRKLVRFLDMIGIPLGKTDTKKEPKGYKLASNELWAVKPTKDKSGLVEIVLEPGVCNSFNTRMDVNLLVFKKIEEIVPAWPWSIFDTLAKRKGSLLS